MPIIFNTIFTEKQPAKVVTMCIANNSLFVLNQNAFRRKYCAQEDNIYFTSDLLVNFNDSFKYPDFLESLISFFL